MENNKNILIVDDDTDICHLMEKIVRDQNYPAKSVNTLEAVLDVVNDYDPQIIFLDNQLPDGDGVDQIKNLKQLHPALRVVLITGDNKPGLREEAANSGADLFISKPFTRAMIRDILNLFLPQGGDIGHAA